MDTHRTALFITLAAGALLLIANALGLVYDVEWLHWMKVSSRV